MLNKIKEIEKQLLSNERIRMPGGDFSHELKNRIYIHNAKLVHGCKYDYSNTKYINSNIKVKIICPAHGEFEQSTAHHLNGAGCRFCVYTAITLSNDEFIELATKVHNNKYDYSKVDYKGA